MLCVDFYPYGEIFATGTHSGKVRLWDSTDANSPMNSYRSPNDGAVTVVRFTPGGEWLLIGHASGTVASWALTDKARAPASLKMHTAAIACIAFHASDAIVATADVGGTVRLFELHETDGSLTPIGAAVDCGLSNPIKSLCFVGASTLVAAADGHVVVLEFAASLVVSNRIAAPALTGVLDVIADAVANSRHVIVSSQTQRPGGVCVWRVRLDSAPVTPKAPVVAVADENTAANPTPPAPAVPQTAVTVAANPPTPKKQSSARATKKTAAAAMTRTSSARTPPVVSVTVAAPPKQAAATTAVVAVETPPLPQQPVVSDERRVLDELLQGHKQIRATLESRARKLEAARLVQQQPGARPSDAIKALRGGGEDVGLAFSVAEQLSKRAQEFADKFEYGPALTLADGAMALAADVLANWSLEETQICSTLSMIAQLAKWCDINASADLDAIASSCRSRISALMRVLRNENALTFKLTTRSRELRHECLRFEKYY